MMKWRWVSRVCVMMVMSVTSVACIAVAGEPVKTAQRPEVWMGPRSSDGGASFRALFEHADQWAQTRGMIDGVCYADHRLDKQFTDDELRSWFAMMKGWNLKFEMEVGAVKPWGTTGAKTFAVEKPKWDRFIRLGAKIHAITMDEPLLCVRRDLHKGMDDAVEQTAAFIERVRKQYPDMLIGEIEPYPSISVEDHAKWIDALQAKLKADHVRGLDFYRLDVNWANFIVQDFGNWRGVRQIEIACRRRKLPFSLIYWASGYPNLKRLGLADDATWYTAIMQQGYNYAMVDGRPDQVVIESWIDAPQRCVPETDEFTFTRSVRDFVERFVRHSIDQRKE